MASMTAGHAYIGTSGWSYAHWKNRFYAGVPRKDWLRFSAERFTGLEINATFYGSQRRTSFERWRDQTPREFRFTMKGNRYLTHTKKLLDPNDPIRRERDRALGLADKLAAVVWQLPGGFKKNLTRLEAFVQALRLWPEPRHVFEFRHVSWFDDEVAGCLRRHDIAVCMSDAADWPMWDRITTDLVYLRLHGHTRTYASSYSRRLLEVWAARARGWLGEGRDVHIYFDNDAEGAAPKDALRLLELVAVGACS